MGKIYVASKRVLLEPVPVDYRHLYFVYDRDNNVQNQNEEVIRGGPSDDAELRDSMLSSIAVGSTSGGTFLSSGGAIEYEIGRPITSSEDNYGVLPGDTLSDRNYSELSLGGVTSENTWSFLKGYATFLQVQNITYTLQYHVSAGSLIPDVFSGTNSNTFVASSLSVAGISKSFSSEIFPGVNTSLPRVTNNDGYDFGAGGDEKRFQIGTGGNDFLSGASSGKNYVLDGGNGSDTLRGNAGNDVLYGGAGQDVLEGGAGNDTFVGSASELNGDSISDLANGDKIIVHGFNGASGTIGAGRVSVSAGQIRIDADGNGSTETVLYGSVPNGSVLLTSQTPNTADSITISVSPAGSALGYGFTQLRLNDGALREVSSSLSVTKETQISGLDNTSSTAFDLTDYNGQIYTLSSYWKTANLPNQDPSFGLHLSEINPQSGVVARTHSMFTDWGVGGLTQVLGLAVTPSGKFYGIGRHGDVFNDCFLFSFNSSSIDTNFEGALSSSTIGLSITSIEFAPNGTLYGWRNTSSYRGLVEIDTNRNGGSLISVRDVGFDTDVSMDSISFTTDGTLIGISGISVYTIDTATGTVTNVGSIPASPGFYTFEATGTLGGATVEPDPIDTITGGAGDDVLTGTTGNDALIGGDGSDTIRGGAGSDTVYGGRDADVVYGNQGSDVLYGNQGGDKLFGGQNSDTVYGGQDEDVVYGNLSDDVLYGNLGADVVYGGQDEDVLYGGQNDDTLFGNLGDDLLFGNLGNDTLVGGAGNDTLQGGGGADQFNVQSGGGADVITDFDAAAGDRVSVQTNINGTGIDEAEDVLQFLGVDANGNAVLNFGNGTQVTLMGVQTANVSAQDFVLG